MALVHVELNRFEVFEICRGRAWLAPVGLRSVEPGDARFSVELSALNRLDDWNTEFIESVALDAPELEDR